MKKLILLVTAVLFALSTTAVMGAEETGEEKKPKPFKVGDTVTTAKFLDMEGEGVDHEFDGDPTAVVFFNSSCSACRTEMTLLNKLTRKEQNLKVVAVCTDVAGAKGVERFVKRTKMDGFDYYIDPDFAMANRFGFSYTPALVLVDKDGKIYYMKGGYMNKDKGEVMDRVSKKM